MTLCNAKKRKAAPNTDTAAAKKPRRKSGKARDAKYLQQAYLLSCAAKVSKEPTVLPHPDGGREIGGGAAATERSGGTRLTNLRRPDPKSSPKSQDRVSVLLGVQSSVGRWQYDGLGAPMLRSVTEKAR